MLCCHTPLQLLKDPRAQDVLHQFSDRSVVIYSSDAAKIGKLVLSMGQVMVHFMPCFSSSLHTAPMSLWQVKQL